MKVILFGASGLVGQGVVGECLLEPTVGHALSIVRNPTGKQHAKLTELVHKDFLDLSSIESQLMGTVAAAQTLARINPTMIFIFVSGTGSDSTEQGSTMWARVKGKTKNALLRLPFKAVYIFRPAGIQPLHGIQSRTPSYCVLYALAKPVFALLKRLLPNHITTTEHLGRAMIRVAKNGFPKPILEARDINQA